LTILQAIILGIVQGLTEFIPVSSSAHLIIVPWLFNWGDSSLSFDMALHMGTLAALIWFFFSDWVRLIKAAISSIKERRINGDMDRKLAWMIVIGSIPGGIAGFLAESKIEQLFHEPNTQVSLQAIIALAIVIILLGAVLFIVDRYVRHFKGLDKMSFKDMIIIGVSQAMAIFPGVSRSGSTITSGLACGLKREAAARFSFLLGAPMLAGAGLLSLYNVVIELNSGAMKGEELVPFAFGFITAAVSGYFCIKFLLRYLQSHNTNIFVFYRWGIAIFIIIVAIIRR
jgi:undecaprenyl-diphosphatase